MLVAREIFDLGTAALVLALAFAIGLGATVGPPGPGAPVLVVAPPWGSGAAQIARGAGGSLVGPQTALFAVIAQFDGDIPVARLRALGAWTVRDGAVAAALCGVPP